MTVVCFLVAAALLWGAWHAHDNYDTVGAVLASALAGVLVVMGVQAL